MKLQEIFSDKGFSTLNADRIVYARDASEFEGTCLGVVLPENKDQLIHMLKFTGKDGVHFTIRGAGTNTLGACIPANSFVVDMSRMNKIIDWEGDTVFVEAGLVLADLLKAVKKKGLFFPIKTIEAPVCSIGGMIALNTYGLETEYGRMEKYVEELEVIDGNGNLLTINGAKLKDFIGVEGSTGIITKAKLKLLQEAYAKSITIFKFNTLTVLMDKAIIMDKALNVVNLEFYDEVCSKFLGLGESLHLVVTYNNDAGVIKDLEEIAKMDELREKLHHIMINKKYSLKEDLMVPLEFTAKLLHWLERNSTPSYGNFRLKIIYPCLREGSKIQTEMHGLVQSYHGDIAGQWGIGLKRKRFISVEKRARFKALKDNYDPNRLLNRGGLID